MNVNKNEIDYKRVISTIMVFLLSCVVAQYIANYFIGVRVANQKTMVQNAAQIAHLHFQSKIENYLTMADSMKKYLVLHGEEKTFANFQDLAKSMQDDHGVVKCIELAKNGVITAVYPVKGNEHALGVNLLKADNRRYEAEIAKINNDYTIAGPFPLVQGGIGALLLDPIYVTENDGRTKFWGYVVIVLDWNKYLKEVNIEHLESLGYSFDLWHENPYTGAHNSIASTKNAVTKEALQVKFEMPNDTWYMDVEMRDGWISYEEVELYNMVSLLVAIMLSFSYWLYLSRDAKEKLYKQELEAALAKAEVANEAKTRFLFNMSHDIRTPMNAILGFTEIAKKSKDAALVADSLAKIELAGELLLKLINEILNISRIESGTLETVFTETNLRRFGRELDTLFSQGMAKKGIAYKLSCEIEDEIVICDKQHMQEICVNLIANAQKFTKPKGKVNVLIKQLKNKACPEGYADYQIIIADTGIGMSEEFQKVQYQLFERERTNTVSHTEGTGLGLSIVKSLMDLLGGKIDCTSAVGKGTTYTLTFRLQIVAAPATVGDKIAKELTEQDLVGKEVLLVEDNEINREIAQFVLEEAGMKVSTAEDGSIAVKLAQEKLYDVILMDIQMPVMNGYEATRAIRNLENKELANVPIIAMTANAFEEDRRNAFEAGMDEHIAKPFKVQDLLCVLAEVLRETHEHGHSQQQT